MASDDVIYRFLDRGVIHGIPARDLTQADVDRLSLVHQRDVRSGKLYEAVESVNLDRMNREQLNAHAVQRGIADVDSYGTKSELIAAIEALDAPAPSGGAGDQAADAAGKDGN